MTDQVGKITKRQRQEATECYLAGPRPTIRLDGSWLDVSLRCQCASASRRIRCARSQIFVLDPGKADLMGQAENSVAYAVEQVCGLYGVQVTREQSRQFNVQGAAGRWRPMFFGQWTDNFGKVHRAGKPDFLARPRVKPSKLMGDPTHCDIVRVSVPLWIECKAKTGRLRPDQAAFQTWVESNGDFYLLLREDVRPLIAWFDQYGVEKNCDNGKLSAVIEPISAADLNLLPCKWCKLKRDQHAGKILSCPLHLCMNDPALIGKVFSPDLRKVKA